MILVSNQKGIGVIGAALMASVMIAMLALLAGYQVENLSSQVAIQRRGLYGIDALQDFAVMAGQARLVRVQNPLPAACPAGTMIRGANNEFCWPDNANASRCIPNPQAAGVAAGAAQLLCLSAAVNPISVAFAPEAQDSAKKWETIARATMEKSLSGLQTLATRFSAKAFAQSMPVQLPALGGAPTSNIGVFACTAATVGNVNCKRCTDAPVGARNVQCTTLQICVRVDGNCNANELVTQVIGVIDR